MTLPNGILNFNRQWDNDVALIPTNSGLVKDAFFGGKAVRFDIKPGYPLYKFNTYPSLSANPAPWSPVSEWWSPYDGEGHDGGWEARLRFAQHLHISVRELGRLTSVIKENWNSLAYLLVIRLNRPVVGFWGTFKGMERYEYELGDDKKPLLDAQGKPIKKSSKLLDDPRNMAADFRPERRGGSLGLMGSGGASQFYIPNLRVRYVAKWEVISLLNM